MEAMTHLLELEDIYPMSDIQKGMIYHSLKSFGNTLYHNQILYQVKYKDFAVDIFKKAFAMMVKKHSILRTGFNLDEYEEPIQVVYRNIYLDIEHRDLKDMGNLQQLEYLRELLDEDKKRPFTDVSVPPLWRLRLFELGNDTVVIMWVFHHAILDGWSNASFLTELNNAYLKLKSNPAFFPGKLKHTYKDFVVEQMVEKKRKEAADYWRKELAGYKRLDFSKIFKRIGKKGPGKLKKFTYTFPDGFLETLKKAALELDTTVKHICFGAYVYMLNTISYEDDIVVGLVTHNRPQCEDGAKILGCFLNTVPVRLKVPGRGRGHTKWGGICRVHRQGNPPLKKI